MNNLFVSPFRVVFSIVLFVFAAAGSARGQSADPDVSGDPATVGVQGGRFGVGFSSSWPAYGISGTLHVNPTFTGEAVIGFFGALTSVGGRLWYRFDRNSNYDLYGYGGVSLYRYSTNLAILGDRVSESVFGAGFGAGIEAGLPTLFKDEEFPPIFVNAELGLALASFEYYGGFSTLALGLGIHYRFGTR